MSQYLDKVDKLVRDVEELKIKVHALQTTKEVILESKKPNYNHTREFNHICACGSGSTKVKLTLSDNNTFNLTFYHNWMGSDKTEFEVKGLFDNKDGNNYYFLLPEKDNVYFQFFLLNKPQEIYINDKDLSKSDPDSDIMMGNGCEFNEEFQFDAFLTTHARKYHNESYDEKTTKWILQSLNNMKFFSK